jgi:hypothetical protein
MPGFTDHYSFPFPVEGDVVSAADWEDLSEAIDDQLTAVDVFRQANLHRPTVSAVTPAAAATIPVATTTNMLFDTNLWAVPSSFHSTSSNTDQFVVPSPGLYLVSASMNWFPQPSGVTAVLMGLTVDNVVQYQYGDAMNATSQSSRSITGLCICSNFLDVIRLTCRWTGTGTASVRATIQIFKVASL